MLLSTNQKWFICSCVHSCVCVCMYVWRHVHVREDAYRNWKGMTDHLKQKFQESLSHLNLMLRTNLRFCKSSMGS